MLLPLLLVPLGLVVWRAWLADDAFITARTLDNFVHGCGLRYNLAERVQAFTHPLWALLVSCAYLLAGRAYWALLAASVACSVTAVGLLAFRLAASRPQVALCLVLLAASQAFVDYSTSGLENPLTHLLLVVFSLRLFGNDGSPRAVAGLAFLGALAMVNRMDTALLHLPALLVVAWRTLRWRAWLPLLLGSAPFLVWELFAVAYYGFPFPNTAYAKLGTGIPRGDLAVQGLRYLWDSLAHDPVTLLSLGVAVPLAWACGDHRLRALAAGGGLYLAYVVAIGGDFMSGRFLSPLAVLAAVLVAQLPLARRRAFAVAAVAAVVGGAHTWPAAIRRPAGGAIPPSGIVDERAYYRGWTALADVGLGAPAVELTASWPEDGCPPPDSVRLEGSIGMLGFQRGPRVHVIDFLGLADPLLARLPTQERHAWRIGHFERKLPLGYLDTLRSGENRIADPRLAEYYDMLSRVVRGRLWSAERWRAIAALNLGAGRELVDEEHYGRPWSFEVQAVEWTRPGGRERVALGALRLPARNGALVRFAAPLPCEEIGLGLALGARYRLTVYRGDVPLAPHDEGRELVHQVVAMPEGSGFGAHTLVVPKSIARSGYDGVLVFPIAANDSSSHAFAWIEACSSSARAGSVQARDGGSPHGTMVPMISPRRGKA